MKNPTNGHSNLVARVAESRPLVKPYFKRLKTEHVAPLVESTEGPWTVPDLCAAYRWPTGQPGGGVIAIIECGGGWVMSDMQKFFAGLQQPLPHITDIALDLSSSPTGDPDGPDAEVALDIQIAAAAYYYATGKPATIRVYWTQDIAAGVRAATADHCDVCSISWGLREPKWGEAAAADMEAAAESAVAAGMTVFAAAGDNDSSDGGPTPMNVDLPASAPSVIGCGGTTKRGSTETVWNEQPGSATGEGTGGGFSSIFPMPSWQIGAPNGPGYMVPDVAANADPKTGYRVFFAGGPQIVGGTSAVAPLYAGLFASFGRKLGFVTPLLWSHQTCFADITVGDNGDFRAAIGPDPCTGLGAPVGKKLAALFGHATASAVQQVRKLTAENARLKAEITSLLGAVS